MDRPAITSDGGIYECETYVTPEVRRRYPSFCLQTAAIPESPVERSCAVIQTPTNCFDGAGKSGDLSTLVGMSVETNAILANQPPYNRLDAVSLGELSRTFHIRDYLAGDLVALRSWGRHLSNCPRLSKNRLPISKRTSVVKRNLHPN